jgi:antirestriction protein ArdC
MYYRKTLDKILLCVLHKVHNEFSLVISSRKLPWLKQNAVRALAKSNQNQSNPRQRVDGEERVTMRDSDVYGIITERILALLEQGTIPWQKPWATNGEDCMPRNLTSRKPYRGVNVFLLHAMSYASPYWLTFRQAQELGGNVRKGEKACPVVFWKWLDLEGNEPDEKKRVPMLRYYSVFNVAQCEGIEASAPESKGREHSPIEAAERIVTTMPQKPVLQHGGTRACYLPAFDRVDMPRPETFQSPEAYYDTLFHELTHSTGHETRLNRKGVAGSEGEWSAFGSTPYAKEELVAEMGGAFLCSHAGIVERTINNSAAYVAGWLERLRNDNRLVVQAAAQAQKAADYILGKQHQAEESEVQL